MSTLEQYLDTDLGNIISNDMPRTIVVSGVSVTGLIEDVQREENNDFGGYNLVWSTRLHIRTAVLTGVTIGNVVTANGQAKRIVKFTKTLDDQAWIIDVDDPG